MGDLGMPEVLILLVIVFAVVYPIATYLAGLFVGDAIRQASKRRRDRG